MDSIDLQYISLVKDILDNGITKYTRNGGVKSVFGRTLRHKFNANASNYPLLTTKKMAFKPMLAELLWFLNGRNDLRYLLDKGCNIWNGDAYKKYITTTNDNISQDEFVKRIIKDDEFNFKYGYLGPIYGTQWRNWSNSIDQLKNVVEEAKKDPDSRRLLVSAWNPSDLPEQTLPPCHYSFQLYTNELTNYSRLNYYCKENELGENYFHDRIDLELDAKNTPKRGLSLLFNMRSNDVPLGLPFNIASYGLLLIILGEYLNMVPNELIINIGDAHIYHNQIDPIKQIINNDPYDLPQIKLLKKSKNFDNFNDFIKSLEISDFELINYKSHKKIDIPLSN